jgi:Uncharacterised protein conserved in bacteria (DUF2336)
MLAALDALIQNGTGGRRTLVLRQICSLFMTMGDTGEGSTTALFDEIMANLAVDLDDDVVTFLAPELQHFSGLLPAFKSTVASRSFENQARKAAIPAGVEPVAAASQASPPSEPVGKAQQPDLDADQEPTKAADTSADSVEPFVATLPAGGITLDGRSETVALPDVSALPSGESAPSQDREIQSPFDRRAVPRDPVQDANNPVTLARRASAAELIEIASVENLPEQLTSVIIMRGDRDAIVRALDNRSARFSRSGLTTLAELAPSDLVIKQALVRRADLPELIIERMLPYLNMVDKTRLLMSGAMFDAQQASAALAQAHADLVNEYRQGQLMPGVDTYVASVETGAMTHGEVVVALAGDMRIAELAMFAARRLGLNHATAMNMVASRLDKTAGILAVALQCERAAITAIMDMRRRCGVCSDARGAIETHLRLGQQEALMLVRMADQMAVEFETVANGPPPALSAAA